MMPSKTDSQTYAYEPACAIRLDSEMADAESRRKSIELNVDDLLKNEVGACGLWQWSIAILSLLSAPVMTTLPVFLNAVPYVRCRMEPQVEKYFKENNVNFTQAAEIIGPPSGCSRYVQNWTDAGHVLSNFNKSFSTEHLTLEPCPYGFQYQGKNFQYPDSIVAEFNLVCSDEWVAPMGTSFFMLGMVVGYIFGGWCGDRFGRRRTAIGFSMVEIVVGVCVSIAPNHQVYHLTRTIVGITNGGKSSVLRILPLELTLAKYRGYFSSLSMVGVLFLHQATLAAWAYLIPSWRWLNIAAMAPDMFSLLFICFLPESPRWLNSQRRQQEALLVLKKGRDINAICSRKSSHSNEIQVLLHETEAQESTRRKTQLKWPCPSVRKLCSFKKPTRACLIVLKTIILGAVLFGIQSSSLFGVLLYARIIKNHVYLVAFLNSLAALPGPIIASLAYRFSRSRRGPLLICYGLASVSLWIGGFHNVYGNPNTDIVLTVCCIFALILLSATMVMLSTYVPELFTSDIRTRSAGLAAGCGRLFSSMSSIVNQSEKYFGHGFPVIIYGASALLAVIILLLMQDTSGENLQDRMGNVRRTRNEDEAQ